jgi:hypothetical protein
MLCLGALLGVFALGCASVAPQVSAGPVGPVPPPWYLSPPGDDTSSFYGVGSAPGLPGAKSAALVDVASKLAVSVRATHSDRQVVTDDRFEQRIESELVSRVKSQKFKAYQVVESALSGRQYYALVRVDRNRLALDMTNSFRELDRDIASRMGRAQEGSALGYYLAYREAKPLIGRARANIELLSTLSPQFDRAPYLARYRAYQDRYETARGRAVVAILPDRESKNVTGVVQELLSDEGLQSEVVRRGARVSSACQSLCIEIETKWQQRYAVRRYISTLTAHFRVKDASGSVAAATQHRTEASSLTGYDEARGAAANKLREELSRVGILEAVGFAVSEDAGFAKLSPGF